MAQSAAALAGWRWAVRQHALADEAADQEALRTLVGESAATRDENGEMSREWRVESLEWRVDCGEWREESETAGMGDER
jgi:hypothetical protein